MKPRQTILTLLLSALALYGCGKVASTASQEADETLDQAAKRSAPSQAQRTSDGTGIADRLGLDDEQRAALAAIQAKYRRLAAQASEQGLSADEVRQHSLRLRNAYDKEVLEILTDEQKKRYEGMKAGR